MTRQLRAGPNRVLAIFVHEYIFGKALGGIERRFVELSNQVESLGIQLFAVEYSPSLSRELRSGYRSVPIARHKPGTMVREVVQLIRVSLLGTLWCRRLKCELIYSPSSVSSQVIPSLIVSILLRKPLVVVFHSLSPSRFKATFGSLLKSRLAAGESVRNALLKTCIEFLTRYAYTRAGACIAVSNATAYQILGSFKPRNLVVSGNGVAREWFSIENAPKMFDACFLGRISPRKGVDLLLLAWKQVLLTYPAAKLVLIGGGESQNYVERCLRMIQTLGLETNVTMTGFIDDNSVRRTLASSKVFVLPSHREGFGLAIVEAMASGLPCILPNLQSLKENFSDSAVFVEHPDPELWARVICQLLGDPETQRRLSGTGRNLASQFRWETVAQREVEVFRRLILDHA